MRKHFLILMLMALLPMAGWADIVVTPGVATKNYGDADPAAATSMFTMQVTGAPDVTKADVVAQLSFVRIETGEDVGTYAFALVPSAGASTALGHDVIVSGNGVLNIAPKDVAAVTPATVADQEFHVGSWNAPTFTWAGMTLDEDYEITGYTTSDGMTAISGMGVDNQVHVQGIGNYTGTAVFEFDIDRMTIGDGTDAKNGMSAEFNAAVNLTYDGTVKDVPAFTIKDHGVAVADVASNFVIMLPGDMTTAGNKYITIAGKTGSPYQNSFKLPFTIAAKDITDESIEFGAVDNVTYTGYAFTPTPTVTDNAILTAGNPTPLESGTHFDYVYEANTNAGNAAKVKVVGKGNYTGTNEITFSIAKRNINDINVSPIANLTYNGVAQTPAVEITAGANPTINATALPVEYNALPTPTGDYTVNYTANTNAGPAKATITAVANSNYTGSKDIAFTINKATITVTPKNFTRALNEDDPTSDYLVANEYYTLTGFQNGETAISANFSGAPSFTILAHGDGVGVYADKIKVNVDEYDVVTGLTAANYKFAAGANANLTITGANDFTIAFKSDITVEYGDAINLAKIYGDDNVNAKNYLVVTGLGEDVIKSMTITVVDENGDVVDPATVKNAGIYYLKATPATISLVEAGHEANYDFAGCTIANGSFEITQRPIAFQAVNQTIPYGEVPSLTTGNDHIALVSGSYAYEDGRSDMNFELTIDPNYNGSVKTHTRALKLSATNPNYEFTLTDGDIIVTAGGATLDLSGLASDEILPRIKDYNNVACNVVISFDNRTRAYRAGGTEFGWTAEKWNTLALPFDISVADLSKALGYAIVNVINPERTVIDGENSKVYGKLTMTGGNADGPSDVLVANKPFMVKTAEAITGNVTFPGVVVKAPTTIEDCTVDAGKGVKFIGTFAEKTVSATDNGKIWFMEGDETEWATIYAGSASTWTLVPFEGYVDLNNASGARNLTFIMEELDGSTTAITSVNADADNMKAEGVYNLNGVKMEGALKKGVYIKDGKKFVVK